MASKKRTTRSKRKNNNALWFLVVFLIILIASIFLGYYFTHNKSNMKTETIHVNDSLSSSSKQGSSSITKGVVDGTWVSEYDGAIMEIHNNLFTLEVPSINSRQMVHGIIKIQGQQIVFSYQSGSNTCNGIQGTYHFEKQAKKKLMFKLISDQCKSRSERMTAAWYPL